MANEFRARRLRGYAASEGSKIKVTKVTYVTLGRKRVETSQLPLGAEVKNWTILPPQVTLVTLVTFGYFETTLKFPAGYPSPLRLMSFLKSHGSVTEIIVLWKAPGDPLKLGAW